MVSGEWNVVSGKPDPRVVLKSLFVLFVTTYINPVNQLSMLNSDMDVQVCDATKA